jgi:single-stranded-DNA-specific exonuclease
MASPAKIWEIAEQVTPPSWLIEKVGKIGAQIIWRRSEKGEWQTPELIESFLDYRSYIPASAESFGKEMELAIARITQAYLRGEKVAIWGDFDADGITATSVLWEGLGEFFKQKEKLVYYIPNRFKESHGLSIQGLDTLKDCQLIITCDTGSTSLSQILYAQALGIDTIVTDHHTLPSNRPPVVSILNPRYFATDSPLYHLSGVAVAYKLVEALYKAMPEIPQSPVENLLDLVAIGLVADLVELKGDCRYLAQVGIEQLRKKQRPGVRFLLEQCKRSGDRATDIGFGIAPRINAISRIWGDADKCVTLLTSKNDKECKELADLAEQANIQRKALQKKLFQQVQKLIEAIDLSTTAVIVLADAEWLPGILGLVAGQVASEYGRPAILCTIENGMAKGSARSSNGIDLYTLVKQQEHLLLSFGGHPFAAGLSLQAENLDLLRETLQQQFWQTYGQIPTAKIKVDLEVTLKDLVGDDSDVKGKELFDRLRLLEPFGMGNPSPKFLLRNCRFSDVRSEKIKTKKGQKLDYQKVDFRVSDRTGNIQGTWWDRYAYDLPEDDCDLIVELIDNTYARSYELRVIDLAPSNAIPNNLDRHSSQIDLLKFTPSIIPDCLPISETLTKSSFNLSGLEQWRTLVGMVKYLNRTGKQVEIDRIQARLGISNSTNLWHLCLQGLSECGWQLELLEDKLSVQINSEAFDREADWQYLISAQRFIQAADEIQFRQRYLLSRSELVSQLAQSLT